MKYEDMSPPETFIFFRKEGWYLIDIPIESIEDNVKSNPGTLRVEDLCGRVLWKEKEAE